MNINITFPGGKQVNAEYAGHIIKTDQPLNAGGGGTAPEPFAYFLASIGTCAGIYVLGFCQARNISTEGLKLTQSVDFDPIKHKVAKITLDIQVPPSFPEKYLNGLKHAAEACAVKKAIQDPPLFEVNTKIASTPYTAEDQQKVEASV